MLISSVWRGESRGYFIGGLLVGGFAMAAMLYLVGSAGVRWWVSPVAAYAGAGIVALVTTMHDMGVISLKLPQNARQVPEIVTRSGPRSGAFQFGVEMGTGARTFLTSALPFVPLVYVLLGASWTEAVCIGLGFGLGRAIVPAVRSIAENDDSWSGRFESSQRPVRVVLNLSVLVCIAIMSVYQGAK